MILQTVLFLKLLVLLLVNSETEYEGAMQQLWTTYVSLILLLENVMCVIGFCSGCVFLTTFLFVKEAAKWIVNLIIDISYQSRDVAVYV